MHHALRGDVNDDGKVNMKDVIMVIQYILGYPQPSFIWQLAKLNDDDVVNMSDVISIINIILGNTEP